MIVNSKSNLLHAGNSQKLDFFIFKSGLNGQAAIKVSLHTCLKSY